MLKTSVIAALVGLGAVPVSATVAALAAMVATVAIIAHLRAEMGPRNSFIK